MPATLSKWGTVSTGRFAFGTNAREYLPLREPLTSWLRTNFPGAAACPMAERHVRLWEWIEALQRGVKPRHRVECWGRGGGKSTSAGLGVVRVGMKQTRRFTLYVSGTQKQANLHVQAIRARFEALGVPRSVNAYGNALGWSMDLLRVANGFNVLALGLDAAGRGVKLDDVRPDLILFDDVDERHDSEETTAKKIKTITESILPTGATDAAVLVVQNKIHSNSIVAQLVDGRADFLLDRDVYEEPAVRGLKLASEPQADGRPHLYRIVEGVATWEGQDLATCEAQVNEWGRGAFLREAQHETDEGEDGLWNRARDIDPYRIQPNKVPDLHRIVVGVDPNATDGGDEAGIIVGGTYTDGGTVHAVCLEDASVAGGPSQWANAAVAAYARWNADALVAESNNGGEMVAITIRTVPGAPPVNLIHASRGKMTRAEPVQKLSEEGRIHHAGVFVALESELCNWRQGDPSPNRLDAFVWTMTKLLLEPRAVPVEDHQPSRSWPA